MRKAATVIALTLAFGIATPAKPHPHHQEALQGKVGDASTTDLWRHYLLHVASWDASIPPSDTQDWTERKIIVAKKFRAEFEKAIDDFNEAQESRAEVDPAQSLNVLK